jgi:hypothetical protein
MGFIVFGFLVQPRGLPMSSLHGASPFEGFPSPAASALAGFLPPHRSPSKDGAISGPYSAGRVRCVLCVLPRQGARSSLGFLIFHRRVASPFHGGHRPEGQRSRGRGHLRSRSARSHGAPPKRAPGPVAFPLQVPPSKGRLFAGLSAWGDYCLTQAGGVQE